MRDKLNKEFSYITKNQNEIMVFTEEYKQLKKLWYTKLCTPLEELLSMQEALVKLKSSTTQLSETLRNKEEAF